MLIRLYACRSGTKNNLGNFVSKYKKEQDGEQQHIDEEEDKVGQPSYLCRVILKYVFCVFGL